MNRHAYHLHPSLPLHPCLQRLRSPHSQCRYVNSNTPRRSSVIYLTIPDSAAIRDLEQRTVSLKDVLRTRQFTPFIAEGLAERTAGRKGYNGVEHGDVKKQRETELVEREVGRKTYNGIDDDVN